jgi:hypothetical protein
MALTPDIQEWPEFNTAATYLPYLYQPKLAFAETMCFRPIPIITELVPSSDATLLFQYPKKIIFKYLANPAAFPHTEQSCKLHQYQQAT